MAPIMRELKKRKIDYIFIHTGQHDFGDLIKTLDVKKPDIIINQKNGFSGQTQSAIKWGIETLPKLIRYFSDNKDIEYVLYHGDTMSTGISSIAAKLTGKKGCHIEAGLRSYNIFEPFPEELMRILADNLSTFKFAPSKKAAKRAGRNSFNVGNTSCESLSYALKFVQNKKKVKKKYAVCTIHRHENIKSRERLEQIAKIITLSPYPVKFFLHENTKKKLLEYGIFHLFKKCEMLNSLSYIDFVPILANSSLIFTDGGGMSEEAAQLNIPIIILRKDTEREELLLRGDQFLTHLDIDSAKIALTHILDLPKKYNIINIYDGGNTSAQIVDILLNISQH